MDDYHFLADLLSTYRSSPDAVKILLALTPLVSVCGAVLLGWMVLRRREDRVGAEEGEVRFLPPQGDEDLRLQKQKSVERRLLSLREIQLRHRPAGE